MSTLVSYRQQFTGDPALKQSVFGAQTPGAATITGGMVAKDTPDTTNAAGSVGAIVGTVNTTELPDGVAIAGGSDLFDGTGSVAWVYSAQITEGDDSVSATSAVGGMAAASVVEQNDTLAAQTSLITFAAAAPAPEQSDTLLADATTAQIIQGALASSEVPDATQFIGGIPLAAADATVAEGDDSVSANASVAVATQAQATEQSDTATADYTVTGLAAVAATEQNDALASTVAADEIIDADLSSTDANDTASSDMAVYVVAVVSGTEQNDAVASDAALIITASLQEVGADDLLASAGSWLDVDDAQLDQAEQDDVLLALIATAFRVQRRSGFTPRDANTSRSKWLSD